MNPQRVPNPQQMQKYVDLGLTQRQIAGQWEADTGVHVSRSAIGMALERYGITTVRALKLPREQRVRHRAAHKLPVGAPA